MKVVVHNMRRFVIGVSGVTCGGKTTLTQLLRRTFPGCRVLHQDRYFYADDDPRHVRLPEAQNHVNYEILSALNMNKMHEDVSKILAHENWSDPDLPGYTDGHDNAPNFEGSELVQNTSQLELENTRHKDVSILLLEGFLIFASKIIYDSCDVRFFLSLNEKECRKRRSERTCYNPPDTPGYFDSAIWNEYIKHFETFISPKDGNGIHILDGSNSIEDIRNKAVAIIFEALDNKFPQGK